MCPPAIAGEEADDMPPSPVLGSAFVTGRGRRSIWGCWSTGKKLHSFLSLMQFEHRFCLSSGARRHRIFRRLQWPAIIQFSQRPYSQDRSSDTYRKQPMCDGILTYCVSSLPQIDWPPKALGRWASTATFLLTHSCFLERTCAFLR